MLRAALAAALLLGLLPLSAQPQPEKRRGRLDHVEVQNTRRISSFRWSLQPSPDSCPRVFFEGLELVTLNKVRVYQVVVEKPVPKKEGEEEMAFVVVPGEFMRGEEFAEQSSEPSGPLGGETFVVNGVTMKTNADGVATDTGQTLVALFDDLSVTEKVVSAKHSKRGNVLLKLTRNVVKRYEPGREQPEDFVHTDILSSFGLDFAPKRTSQRDGVSMALAAPASATPGQEFELTVTVTNNGSGETSSVLGHTFSRYPWLHGRIFYFGCVQPNTSKTFTRRILVPEGTKPGTAYAGIGFWDLLGTVPGKGIVLKMELLPGKDTPEAAEKPQPEAAP
jgi:hypothetical protein